MYRTLGSKDDRERDEFGVVFLDPFGVVFLDPFGVVLLDPMGVDLLDELGELLELPLEYLDPSFISIEEKGNCHEVEKKNNSKKESSVYWELLGDKISFVLNDVGVILS